MPACLPACLPDLYIYLSVSLSLPHHSLGPEETVRDNLAYGIKMSPSTDHAALEKRCRAVLAGLGGEKAKDLLENFNTPGYLGVDGCKVTRMSRQLIHIARALVMNPEMLIVHKPMPLLSPEVRPMVLAAFQEYCHNRGYLMSKTEPLIRRRKRTLIYTGYTADEVRCEEIKESWLASDKFCSVIVFLLIWLFIFLFYIFFNQKAEMADLVFILQDGELTLCPKEKIAQVVAQFGNQPPGVDL